MDLPARERANEPLLCRSLTLAVRRFRLVRRDHSHYAAGPGTRQTSVPDTYPFWLQVPCAVRLVNRADVRLARILILSVFRQE